MPVLVRAWGDKEFEFHLLELPHPEDKVPGRDLIAEGLADLRNPEGRAPCRGIHHVAEVREDGLGRLRTHVGEVGAVVYRAHGGFEHQVEGPGFR